MVAWYQLPKARIRKSFKEKGDLKPVNEGIEELIKRKPIKPRQILDKQVSIEALRRFVNIKIPSFLKEYTYQIVKNDKTKSIFINNVEIIISPDVIYKVEIEGKTYVGAVKIHISKNNVFDSKQSAYISSLIFQYLKQHITGDNEEVLEELCFSLDVFAESIISTPINHLKLISDVEKFCTEIKEIWKTA